MSGGDINLMDSSMMSQVIMSKNSASASFSKLQNPNSAAGEAGGMEVRRGYPVSALSSVADTRKLVKNK